MKYIIIYCLLVVVPFSKCTKKLKPSSGTPACIEALINSNKNNSDWEVGHIEEYRFHEKLVYALQPDMNLIADAATTIQAADCSLLCTIGGFRGGANSSCDGGNFYEEAVLVRKVWQKPGLNKQLSK